MKQPHDFGWIERKNMDVKADPMWLTHPKEIHFGRGRIVYDEYPRDGLPGWRLPGGGVTADVDVATHAARWIEMNAMARTFQPRTT